MRPARAALILPLLALLLAGCAERWTRPGTSEAEAEAAQAACADRAALEVPAQNVWMMVDPGGFEHRRRCWRTGQGQTLCEWWPVYRPPRHAWVDVNQARREAWRRECLHAQGFRFEGYRPLRLD